MASPWLSSQTNLRELANKGGCAVLTNRERGMRKSKLESPRYATYDAFRKLKVHGALDRVRALSVGVGSGKLKSIGYIIIFILI